MFDEFEEGVSCEMGVDAVVVVFSGVEVEFKIGNE